MVSERLNNKPRKQRYAYLDPHSMLRSGYWSHVFTKKISLEYLQLSIKQYQTLIITAEVCKTFLYSPKKNVALSDPTIAFSILASHRTC